MSPSVLSKLFAKHVSVPNSCHSRCELLWFKLFFTSKHFAFTCHTPGMSWPLTSGRNPEMLPRDKHLRAVTTPRVLLHLLSFAFGSSNYIKQRFLKLVGQLKVCQTPHLRSFHTPAGLLTWAERSYMQVKRTERIHADSRSLNNCRLKPSSCPSLALSCVFFFSF